MKTIRPALLALLAVYSPPAPAENLHPKSWARLEGSVTLTQGGLTSRATVQWQAPDKLRVETHAPGVALVVVANADETRLLDPVTTRVRRLTYNVTRQPWRGWALEFGGPANVVLFGASDETLAKSYKPAPSTAPNTKVWVARDDVGRHFVRDWVRTGGMGDNIFYAANKHWVFDRPAQWLLITDPATKFISTRRELDEKARVVAEVAMTYVNGLPRKAVVRDGNTQVVEFSYDLKERAEEFPAETFALPAPDGQIIEDQELRPLADYTGTDASSQFNLGQALATHAEDFPAALKVWKSTAAKAPRALAPPLALFNAALACRQLGEAQNALAALEKISGAESPLVLARKVTLAAALRNWPATQAALDAVEKSRPGDANVLLARANLQRVQGEFDKAQAGFIALFSMPDAMPSVLADAAVSLAAMTAPAETEAVAAAIKGDAPGAILARALLTLQGGRDMTVDTKNWPTELMAVLALARERNGQDELARAIWQTLADRSPLALSLTAKRRLMALAARRGDAVDSMRQFRELLAWTNGEGDRQELERALLTVWRKAEKLDQLKVALDQRAQGSLATPDDRRTMQVYREAFGTPDEMLVGNTTGLARYPKSAWWLSRAAEYKTVEASVTPNSIEGVNAQQRKFRDAVKKADEAIAADPGQPYYHLQRTLILTQKLLSQKMVAVAGDMEADRRAAIAALDEVLTKFPGDPDVEISVAMQRMAVTKRDPKLTEPIAMLDRALRTGLPGQDGGDRHETAFPARQMLAIALRSANRGEESSEQFDIALHSCRNATEALGIAVNQLNLFIDKKAHALIPPLLTRIAQEAFPFSDSQQLQETVTNVLVRHPQMGEAAGAALKASKSPYAKIAAANLWEKITARNNKIRLAPPDTINPNQADADWKAASKEYGAALEALIPLTDSADPIVAAQAAAMLGENNVNLKDFEGGRKWLEKAIALDPHDVNLRVALATASVAAKADEDALNQRDRLLRALPTNFENLKQAALISRQLGKKADTVRLCAQALRVAKATEDVQPGDEKFMTFTYARALFDNNQLALALEQYNLLAAAVRPAADRAAAIMDAEARLRNSGATNEANRWQLRMKDFTPDDLRTASRLLKTLE